MTKDICAGVIGLICGLVANTSLGFSAVNLNTSGSVYIPRVDLCKDYTSCNEPLLVLDEVWLGAVDKNSIPLAFSANSTYPYVQIQIEAGGAIQTYRTRDAGCQITFSKSSSSPIGTAECCINNASLNKLPTCK
jgi:hypothetical protein